MKKILFTFLSTMCLSLVISQNPLKIKAGDGHSISLCNDGTVRTWGRNTNGQLGNGNTSNSSIPVVITNLSGVVDIDAGGFHSIALLSNGNVSTWGSNINGQLGNGTYISSDIPVQLNTINNITNISVGKAHSMTLKSDSTIWNWGENQNGQLGNNSTVRSNIPVQVMSLTKIIAISAGNRHSLALKSDGTVWSWGAYVDSVPLLVPNLTNVIAISGGFDYSLALKSDGTVWAWGCFNCNNYGQFGNGTNTSTGPPVQMTGVTGVTAISAGYWHSLVLKNNGTVSACGYNGTGQLGSGNSLTTFSLVPVVGLTNVTSISAGKASHSLALKNDGTAWAWGSNNFGKLGTNATYTTNVYSPTQIAGLCQTTTEISEETKNNPIYVYPIPTSGITNIIIAESIETELVLYSIAGQKIMSKTINDKVATIDLSGLTNGIYYLQLKNEAGIETKKIILNK